MGRARDAFVQHCEGAGLQGPPSGGLEDYSTEVVSQIQTLKARCHEGDDERLYHIQAMESAARGLLAWIEDPPPRPPRRAKTPPAPTPAPAEHRLEQRAAQRRAAMRRPRTTP